MPKLILHHIDVLNEEYVSGWCLNRLTPWHTITLDFYFGNERIGGIVCNQPRDDVKRAGLHRSGDCGFEFKLPSPSNLNRPGDFRITCYRGLISLCKFPFQSIPSVVNPSNTVFFMHIPKTAGTSFNNHVHSWFGYGKWHSHIEVLDLETQRALIKPGHYLAGHIPLYRLREIESDFSKLDIHSIVRRPIDQLHSHLSWLKGIGTDPDSGFFRAHQPIIQELSLQMQDVELSHATGIENFVNAIEGFQFDFFDNIQTRYMLASRPQQVSDADLDQAIENLSVFKTIGTTESYHEYLDQCAKYYQRKASVQSTRHNPAKVSALFDKTDPSVLDAIDPLIHFDNQLYKTILESQIWQN